MIRDLFSSTVDAARALAEDTPLLDERQGDTFPGPTPAGLSEPYVSSRAPGVVRKPCETCGRASVPHFDGEVGVHVRPDGDVLARCAAGTVRFG